MTEEERQATGAEQPVESDEDVEAQLLKEALASGVAAAAMFAGASTANAQWQPSPGAGGAVVVPEPGSGAGNVVEPGPGGAGGAVVDPGPGSGSGGVVDPGPGSASGAVVDPGPGSGGNAVVDPGPDWIERTVAAGQAATKKAAAAKTAKARKAIKKPPLDA